MGDAFEPTVALPVARHVGSGLLANRERRRAPQLATLFIPDVDRFTRRVAHRIVRPRGQLVFVTVERPRIARARLGHLEAEVRIRDHVDPGRRRPLSLTEDGHILPSIRRKAAQAVEGLESRPRRRNVGGRLRRGVPRRVNDRSGLGSLRAHDLFG